MYFSSIVTNIKDCNNPKAIHIRISSNLIFVEHVPFHSLQTDSRPFIISNLPQFPGQTPHIIKVYN